MHQPHLHCTARRPRPAPKRACSGVQSVQSRAFTSAPSSTRAATVSRKPQPAEGKGRRVSRVCRDERARQPTRSACAATRSTSGSRPRCSPPCRSQRAAEPPRHRSNGSGRRTRPEPHPQPGAAACSAHCRAHPLGSPPPPGVPARASAQTPRRSAGPWSRPWCGTWPKSAGAAGGVGTKRGRDEKRAGVALSTARMRSSYGPPNSAPAAGTLPGGREPGSSASRGAAGHMLRRL